MAIPRPLAFSLAILLASTLPLPAAATTIVVSTTADDVTVNGNCTLREAVIAANSDAPADACPAGSSADTVVLRAGTYRLSLLGSGEGGSQTGDLNVHGAVTIIGAGAASTAIEGGASDDRLLRDRVIHVSGSGSLTLSRVAIRGGYCPVGGGIFNEGELQVVDSRIEGNISSFIAEFCAASTTTGAGGAGIVNASTGRLAMLRSSVSGNFAFGDGDTPGLSSLPGGGLMNLGQATISASTFIGNYGAMGGAVFNLGHLRIYSSQLSTNYSRFRAAALWNLSDAEFVSTTVDANMGGDVILNESGGTVALLRILNSTISGNFSLYQDATVYNRSGNVYVTASTIAGNTAFNGAAGLGGPGRTELADSIVFNPANEWGPNGDCQFPVISGGNNIDGDGSCGLSEEQGDQPNTNPLLGPLANNGGPTPTHAPLSGSPAIDAIPLGQCLVSTDQRGVARPTSPRHGPCDIGAYERSPIGDLELIANEVRQLSGLSDARRLALLQILKHATIALLSGDAAGACSALGTFATEVSAYEHDHSLSSSQAASLLAAAERVRGLVCH